MQATAETTTTAIGKAGGGPAADALLFALKAVARHFDRPDSDTILTAGLPLEDGKLTRELLLRAAERVGLNGKPVSAGIDDVLPVSIPAVLFVEGEVPIVVLRQTADNEYAVVVPYSTTARHVKFAELETKYSGEAITFEAVYSASDEMSGPGTGSAAGEHWFWDTLRRYKRDYLNVALAATFINLLGLASPLFIMNVYDRVLPNEAFPTLWVLAIGLGLALIFDFALKSARARLIDQVGRRVDIRLASAIFEKVLNLSLAVRPPSTGAFANRVSQYEFIREFFTSNTIALFTDLFFIFIYFIVIWTLAGWLVVFPLLAVILVIATGIVLQQVIGKRLQTAQNIAAMRQGMLVESVASIETIKSLRAEGHLLRKWDNNAHSASGTAEEIKKLSSFGVNVSTTLQQLVTVGIIVGGAYSFSEGEMSTGAIIATVILSSRAMAPLSQIAMTLTRARQAFLSLRLLDGIMELPDERVSSHSFVNRTVERGEFEFRDVKFHYPQSRRNILNGANFRISAGEKVGLVGRIGSGKTTIARLMSGLYFATGGEVLVDGVDIRQYHPHEIRKAVGLVVQEADLFEGTVKENILLGNPSASDEELIEAAQLAGVDAFISQNEMGYDLPVGERGSALSGGQRQAVALARVLIKKPGVLILDEPTSSMDLQSEKLLTAHLKKAIRDDQTVLISTHRQGMLELVDRLMVIDRGRIVADGPRDAVLKKLTRAPAAPGGSAS